MNVTGADIRKVREQLGEDQTTFGARFDVHRRTVIRWEKSAARWFTEYGAWNRPDRKTEADLWREVVKLAAAKSAPRKNSKRKSTTALGARKPKTARRRKSARKAVTAKRRRGGVARRRSVAKAKKKSRTRRARR